QHLGCLMWLPAPQPGAHLGLGPAVTEAQVRSWLRGREPHEAAEMLAERIELVDEPSIRITPTWWERLPILPGRVNVIMTAAG
ncbi:MAG: hypothetical protein J7M15_06570, partial [Anaerolineae bacterium]|nr:hypothetical protein [Anaerolineae bacterium]